MLPTELVTFDALKARYPQLPTARRLQALAQEGQFPPFARLSPRSPALWSLAAVERWIAAQIGEPLT